MQPYSFNNLKVLIVDDNAADAFYCSELLSESGFLDKNIVEVSSLKEMIEALQKNTFDVVLLDLFLPDSYGYKTYDQVKEFLEGSVVLVMSGLSDKEVALNVVQSGAQDFLLKGDFDQKLLTKSIAYGLERKKSIKLLEKSEKRYKSLFEQNPLPLIIFCKKDFQILNVNSKAAKIYGYSYDDFIKKNISDIVLLKEKDISVIIEDKEHNRQCNHLNASGKKIFTNSYFQEIFYEDRYAIMLLVEDITERVMFERNKMSLVNKIQDEERKHFAMELHDGLAQGLVLLNMILKQIKTDEKNSKLINKCIEVGNDSIAQTRRLTYNISPPFLDEGLINGLSALFERVAAVDGLDVLFEVLNDDLYNYRFNNEVAYNIFRIIQEFINNSLKHSKATRLICSINIDDSDIYFEVSDNGIGFDENNKLTGLGVRNIKERAKTQGFELEFSSLVDKGTRMILSISTTPDLNLIKLDQSYIKK